MYWELFLAVTIVGASSFMAKFKIIGIDAHTHTTKYAYVEAESKAKALNIAYHQPFYIPIRAIEIENE